MCAPDNECSLKGSCVLNTISGMYGCKCKDGFLGNNCQYISEDINEMSELKIGFSKILNSYDLSADVNTAKLIIGVAH